MWQSLCHRHRPSLQAIQSGASSWGLRHTSWGDSEDSEGTGTDMLGREASLRGTNQGQLSAAANGDLLQFSCNSESTTHTHSGMNI